MILDHAIHHWEIRRVNSHLLSTGILCALLAIGVRSVEVALATADETGIGKERSVLVKDFGATPNDGKDDSKTIRKAIDHAGRRDRRVGRRR